MRISDWSPDVCSSALPLPNGSHRRARAPVANHAVALFRGDPSSVLRQLGENLIDLDLADRRRGLVVCIDPPPLNRAARITGSVQPVMHPRIRSEEHTSELQSLMRTSYAVFCFKKTNNNNTTTATPSSDTTTRHR